MTVKHKKIVVFLLIGAELTLALISGIAKIRATFFPERVFAFEHWGAQALSYARLYEGHGAWQGGGRSASSVRVSGVPRGGHTALTHRVSQVTIPYQGVNTTPSYAVSDHPKVLYQTSDATLHSYGGSWAVPTLSSAPSHTFHISGYSAHTAIPTLSFNTVTYTAVDASQYVAEMAAEEIAYQEATTPARMGAPARMNAPAPYRAPGTGGGSVENSWVNWLSTVGSVYASSTDGANLYFSYSDLQAAYNAWISTLSSEMPIPPFEEWLSWIQSSENASVVHWLETPPTPVGDGVIFLLILCLCLAYPLRNRNIRARLNTSKI